MLVLAFSIAIVISTTVVERVMTAKAREDLQMQGNALVEYITTSRLDISEPRRLITYMRNSNVTNLVSQETFLINANKQVVYRSSDQLSDEFVKALLTREELHPNYLIFAKNLVIDDAIVGHLILISEVQHIQASTRVVRNGLIFGMLIALLFGSVIALIMRKQIVKPIKELKDDIVAATTDPEYVVRSVNSQDEIQELYSAFDHMNHTINAHMDERKRFFQNASHELKTPLMSIQGYAEAIKDGIVEGDEVDRSLDIIIDKSQQLKKTVEEIIYLSKLMNQDFDYDFKPRNIVELVKESIEDQRNAAKESAVNILFESNVDAIINDVDEVKFRSVIENLISNAIRYAESVIKVEIKEETGRWFIRVMDDGKGLEEDEVDKVFERFYKGEGGKSGIGLAIVSEIVKLHGGHIRAGNHISGGAVFEIRMDKEV